VTLRRKIESLSEATLVSVGDGRLGIRGELTFASVPDLWQQSKRLFTTLDQGDLELDLKEVYKVDSAGLALLVAWTRWAHSQTKSLHFQNIPPQLQALARANNLNALLDPAPDT
jgi:phospholipid transport system transporter-binding protein